MFRVLLSFSLLLPLFAMATELKPWFSTPLELQPKATYVNQLFHSVDTPHRHKKYPSDDHFLLLSLSAAYDVYSVEVETTLADTRHRSFGVADISLTGRYQIRNDVIGDPASIVAGVTVEQVFKQARKDVGNFYHGGIQAEAHLAVGRETVCWQFWRSRWWGVGGVGVADTGSPWLRLDLGWDHNWWDRQQLGVYMLTLWGLGNEGLDLKGFGGYGPIRHQSVDLGVEYKYHFEFGGIAGLGYGYRVFAQNCPRHVNFFSVSFLYPFGL